MTRSKLATVMLALALLLAISYGDEQNWPFVAFYVFTALFALWHGAWLALATAASVAVVRGMGIASVTFAALFLLLVIESKPLQVRGGQG